MKVDVNRTEALDASRATIRNEELILPRRTPIIEEFARHMTADAKILDEKTKVLPPAKSRAFSSALTPCAFSRLFRSFRNPRSSTSLPVFVAATVSATTLVSLPMAMTFPTMNDSSSSAATASPSFQALRSALAEMVAA